MHGYGIRVHVKNAAGLSPGHVWIELINQDEESIEWGYYPLKSTWSLLFNPIDGVPGDLRPETGTPDWSQPIQQITKEQYDAVNCTVL